MRHARPNCFWDEGIGGERQAYLRRPRQQVNCNAFRPLQAERESDKPFGPNRPR